MRMAGRPPTSRRNAKHGPKSKSGASRSNAGMSLWRLSGMGFEFVSHVCAGMLIGFLADRTFGTGPRWLVVGLICGLIVGMNMLIRSAIKANRESMQDQARRGRAKPRNDD
jgi:F0F1-type ATP synthase assembly protein I